MIDFGNFIESQGSKLVSKNIPTIVKGKASTNKIFKVHKEWKSKTAKQAEKQS